MDEIWVKYGRNLYLVHKDLECDISPYIRQQRVCLYHKTNQYILLCWEYLVDMKYIFLPSNQQELVLKLECIAPHMDNL